MTTDVLSAWDDLDTLVFDREDLQTAVDHTREILDREDTNLAIVAPPTLVPLDEDELWLASIPASARAVLESAKRRVPAWPHAPRLAHAVARPSVTRAA